LSTAKLSTFYFSKNNSDSIQDEPSVTRKHESIEGISNLLKSFVLFILFNNKYTADIDLSYRIRSLNKLACTINERMTKK